MQPLPNSLIIIGTAGAGKSVLTAALHTYLSKLGADVITVNLDPAVLRTPYKPDIDIREYIDIQQLQEKYELGPNGAMIAATDLIVSKEVFPIFMEELREYEDVDGILIDTPGQMEVFAYRVAGPRLIRHFSPDTTGIVFLYDSALSVSPSGLASIALLSASVQFRLDLPIIPVLSKVDLLTEEQRNQIFLWMQDFDAFEKALREQSNVLEREIGSGIISVLEEVQSVTELIPISAKTNEGFDLLGAAISNIWTTGEGWTL